MRRFPAVYRLGTRMEMSNFSCERSVNTLRIIKSLGALGMAALILFSLLGAVLICAFDADTYAAQSRASLTGWTDAEITAYIGMDAQTQQACGERIRDYFAGRASDMDFILPDGTHAFNAKELSHMQDVRGLITLGVKVLMTLGGVIAACGIVFLIVRRNIAPMEAAQTLWDGMKIGFSALLVLVIALTLWALADFRAAFELFHRLAFTNEDWLLDPRTDRLIRMMPQQLFETLCAHIALMAAALPMAIGAGMILYRRHCERAAKRKLRK